MKDTESSGRVDFFLGALATLLTLYALFTLSSSLLYLNGDFYFYIIPWYEHILHFGRLASLEGSYANYTPPYLYLLSFASLLQGFLPVVVIPKLVPIVFLIPAACLTSSICRSIGCTQRRSLLAAWLVVVAPEVTWNVYRWGQSDIIYTTFILLFIRLFWARHPGWSMTALGIALSFKLQAIFIGPVVLSRLLSCQQPLWSILSAALAWIVMMVPAAVAGRPIRDLLLIFANQANTYPYLSMDAPNLYELAVHWTNHSLALSTLTGHIALLITAVCTAAFVTFLIRSKVLARSQTFLVSTAFSLLMEPFVLPRMHDRYFFPGNIIVIMLGVASPHLFGLPAVLLQIGAVIAYYPFLFDQPLRAYYFIVASFFMTGAMIIMLLRARNRTVPNPASHK
jgi:Gpi18-like mannosyltransferase